LRTHVSVRLSPDQMRRLKTAAAQLHLSRQKIVADGLDVYLDKLAAEDLAGCRCLKAKN
jgi:predicted transcriptional regulator